MGLSSLSHSAMVEGIYDVTAVVATFGWLGGGWPAAEYCGKQVVGYTNQYIRWRGAYNTLRVEFNSLAVRSLCRSDNLCASEGG